jgi:uncharacterized membrane protein
MPPETLYHRSVGWHAPALRRAVFVLGTGLAAMLVLLGLVPWELAVMGGWDAAAIGFLTTVWPIILRADSEHARQLSAREDENRGVATALLIGAGVASLTGVVFTVGLAARETGPQRLLLIGAAMLTVVLSWTLVNTVYTLHYAHRHYASTNQGIEFGDSSGQRPDYRDFAYVAFTIGMTYQVSDTTVGDRRIRRSVLVHSLLSYLFGVVIVAGSVNLIAGLIS